MTETAILKTAAHELTHFIQANSAQYEALKSFVVNKLTHEEGVSFENLVADKQRREPGLEYDEAVDEVVADACEMMLGDSTVVEQLAKENRSLAEKIRDWLREWVENLKIALEGLQADRTESRAMMQYARELQEIWDNALMDAARNNRGAVEAESRQQASPRKKYWRPDLAENEWRLLERRMGEEIGSREDFLDEATKWVYANEKGVQVFALYGIGDGTDATPLYAVGGEKAAAAADMQKFVNGGYHYDKGTGTALSRIRGFLRTQGDGGGDIRETSRGGSAGTDDALYGGERKGNAGKSAERGSEDQRGVKEKFSMREPVEETRDLLALHNMTPDNLPAELRIGLEKQGATVREYKAGDEQSRLEAVNADERVRFQQREPRLSDRDVLRMAADMAQRDRSQRWSVDDLNRFDLLQRKLLQLDEANAELEALKEERKVLLAGRKVKELTRDEQFELAQNRNRTETQKGKMFVNRIQRVARS